MKKTKIWNLVCVVLMAAVLVLQFAPFWEYGDGQSTSIQTYIWFPGDCNDLTAYLEAECGSDFNITSIVSVTVLTLVCMAAGVVCCLWQRDNLLVKLLPVIGGIAGIWGFLTKPCLRLGSTWVLQLVLCIAVIAAAVLSGILLHKEESDSKK